MTKFDVDISTLKKIAQLLNKENLAEIEIEQGDNTVRITRTNGTVMSAPQVMASAPVVPAPVETQSVASAPSIASPEESKPNNKNAVKSPIVGTAYLASSPDKDNFISVGRDLYMV